MKADYDRLRSIIYPNQVIDLRPLESDQEDFNFTLYEDHLLHSIKLVQNDTFYHELQNEQDANKLCTIEEEPMIWYAQCSAFQWMDIYENEYLLDQYILSFQRRYSQVDWFIQDNGECDWIEKEIDSDLYDYRIQHGNITETDLLHLNSTWLKDTFYHHNYAYNETSGFDIPKRNETVCLYKEPTEIISEQDEFTKNRQQIEEQIQRDLKEKNDAVDHLLNHDMNAVQTIEQINKERNQQYEEGIKEIMQKQFDISSEKEIDIPIEDLVLNQMKEIYKPKEEVVKPSEEEISSSSTLSVIVVMMMILCIYCCSL